MASPNFISRCIWKAQENLNDSQESHYNCTESHQDHAPKYSHESTSCTVYNHTPNFDADDWEDDISPVQYMQFSLSPLSLERAESVISRPYSQTGVPRVRSIVKRFISIALQLLQRLEFEA